MNRNLRVALMVAPLVVFGGVEASRGEVGPYVGGSWGSTTLQHEASSFDDGSLSSPGKVDEDDSGWKVYGGYRFSKHFALEAGYTLLNNDYDSETTLSDALSDGSGSFARGSLGVDIHEPEAIYAAAVGILPIAEKLALHAKLGAHFWEAELTTFETTGLSEKDESGIDPMVGLGLEYRFTRRWALRAEWERFKGIVDDDIDLVSAGITFGFGSRSSAATASAVAP